MRHRGPDNRAEAPLRAPGGWLDELGERAEAVCAAYAEWLATIMPTAFPPAEAPALVARLTGTGTHEAQEEDMAFSVLEERLQRQFRRVGRENRRAGIEEGIERGLAAERKLLLGLAMRKFGGRDGCAARAPARRYRRCRRLERVGEWLIGCADGDELIARFGNGAPPGA